MPDEGGESWIGREPRDDGDTPDADLAERIKFLESRVYYFDHRLIPWLRSEIGFDTPSKGNINRHISEDRKLIDDHQVTLRGKGDSTGLIGRVDSLAFYSSAKIIVLAIGFGLALGLLIDRMLAASYGSEAPAMPATELRMFPSPMHSNVRNAAICANFAVLAYGHDPIMERVYREYVHNDSRLPHSWGRWKNNTAQGVFARLGESIVIAIAGTNDRFDLLLDLDCGMVTAGQLSREHSLDCCGDDETVFHRGFANYTMMARNALELKAIHVDLDGVETAYVCGHSLGGAAATYMPWVLPQRFDFQVYSYGAPRCFGKRTVKAYPYQLMRLVRNTDPVPLVPWVRFHHPLGAQQRVMRYPGDLAMHRNPMGYAIAAAHWANPWRCFFSKAKRGHSAASYAADLAPHLAA